MLVTARAGGRSLMNSYRDSRAEGPMALRLYSIAGSCCCLRGEGTMGWYHRYLVEFDLCSVRGRGNMGQEVCV